MDCYMDSVDPSIRDKVVEQPNDRLFKFGRGTVLQAAKKVTFPCAIAENRKQGCTMKFHIQVKS